MLHSKNMMKLICAVAIGACAAGPAFAEGESAEIRGLNEEIAVLTTRLSKLEVEAKIVQKQIDLNKMRGEANSSQPSLSGQDTVVRSIEGVDGKLRATLSMRGGMTKTVGVGEKFGSWLVKAITISAVTIAKDGKELNLAFGNEPPPAVASQASAPFPVMGR